MRPAGYVAGAQDEGAPTAPGGKTLAEMVAGYERSVITAAAERHHGNLSAAARSLGISPRMMYYKVSRLGASRDALASGATKMV